MTQPVWITPAGSLGVIRESFVYRNAVVAESTDPITYRVIAGTIPPGMQFLSTGAITGIPYPVGRDVTSRFTVRASTTTIPSQIADRTFSITVTGNNVPVWVTPAGSIGSFYTSQKINYQFQWDDNDPDDTVVVRLVSGQLPGGLNLSSTGLLTGYIQPAVSINAVSGYDVTGQDLKPYDFLYQAPNKNYEFTLETTDGKNSDLRVFSMYVYNRATLNASTTQITSDDDFVTADETPANAPFLTNADPSDLGSYKSSNYYAYQFVGEDYDNEEIVYAISINEGVGLPPGLVLDKTSGWYYGYIPDQGATETTYSFNIVVYKKDFVEYTVEIYETNDIYIKNDPVIGPVTYYNTITCSPSGRLETGQPIVLAGDIGGLIAGTTYYVSEIVENVIIETPVVGDRPQFESYTVFKVEGESPTDDTGSVVTNLITECVETTAGTNAITCNSTEQLGIGQPLIFTGTAFGGLVADPQQVYYVHSILSRTRFTVTTVFGSSTATELTSGTGFLTANLITASEPYPFLLTITGAVDDLVSWITPSDLGSIVNGSVSILKIEAQNSGGRTLLYRLKSGDYNLLPQGLELQPTGEIVGRVSFDTFSLDLGATTFDQSFAINRNISTLGTTFDLEFQFTVNAYAPDSAQILYKVKSITVTNGGSGYSSINPPTIVISAPTPGATSVQALVGTVTVVGGSVVEVEVLESGDGYLEPPTLTITQGFGGSGAEFEAVMEASGSRDAVSSFQTFTVRVIREYNEPYQNLLIRAMPPQNDRDIINSLLTNTEIFPEEWLYRPTDPNFGLAKNVTYAHAYGLAPDTFDTYVAALYENHYWKNLVLGGIKTAQALDESDNVIYEVVYSQIIDDLVNNNNESVGKIVNLPYEILNPVTLEPVTQVYPNSLDNMRTQMVDVVGQISTTLPRWMVSKQTTGTVLGYTPAWVIAYTIPGKSKEIAYRISTEFLGNLNQVDFKVDRYILDCALSRNWNYTGSYISGHNPPPGPVGDLLVGPGTWNPQPPTITTFDRFATSITTFLTTVDIATDLAYTDVNNRTLSEINALGGLDGIISGINGNTLIFAKQQDYPDFPTTDAAWQYQPLPFGEGPFSSDSNPFDYSYAVPGGSQIECFETFSGSNQIVCNYTGDIRPGQEITFLDDITPTIGGIVANTIYYVLDIIDLTHFRITATAGGVTPVTLTNDTGLMYADAANERMAIYTISVDPVTSIVTLTLTTQTYKYNEVQVTRGDYYRSAYLYYPGAPAPGLVRVDWQPVIAVPTSQTTFDQNSMQFIDPVDMYSQFDPITGTLVPVGDELDKYLVFPKSNILV